MTSSCSTGALVDAVRRPSEVLDNVRGGVADVKAVGARVLSTVGSVAAALARTAARPAPTSPLNVEIGAARRWVMVGHDLDDYRKVRARLSRGSFSDDVTVNDVVLATVAGALRAWLLTRGEAVTTASTVRAMVPVSVYDAADPGSLGNRVTACFVDLPVGEPRPLMRLHQIAFAMRQQMEGGQAVGAEALAGIAGFAPPTLHSLGARLGSAMSTAAVQPRHHQRARAAGVPVRRRRADALDLPRHAARARVRRCRSGSRRTTAVSTTGSTPTATRCPTSTSSASAWSTRSPSWWTAGSPRGDRAPTRAGPRRRGRPRRSLDGRGAARAARTSWGSTCATVECLVGTSAGSVLAACSGPAWRSRPGRLPARAAGDARTRWPGSPSDHEEATGGDRPVRPRAGIGSGGLLVRNARHLRHLPPTAVLSAFLPEGRGRLDSVGALVSHVVPQGWVPRPGLTVVALDYDTGARVPFGRSRCAGGRPGDAVMASCAIPGWYQPVRIGEHRYIDGGAWSSTNSTCWPATGWTRSTSWRRR